MFNPNKVCPWWKVNQSLSAVHLASASLTDHFLSLIPDCAKLSLIKATSNGRLSTPPAGSGSALNNPNWWHRRMSAVGSCVMWRFSPSLRMRLIAFFVANELAIQSAPRGWQVFMCVPRVMNACICILSPRCQSLHAGRRRL